MNRKTIASLLLSGAALLLSGILLVQGLVLEKASGEAQAQAQNTGTEKTLENLTEGPEERLTEAGEEAAQDNGAAAQDYEEEPAKASWDYEEASDGGLRKDTSEGNYQMTYMGAEHDGWLYYMNYYYNVSDEYDPNVYRYRVDGSGQREIFIETDPEDWRQAYMIMATDQFFYLVGVRKVNQYTWDGQIAGSFDVPTAAVSWLWRGMWDQGYFYYIDYQDHDDDRLYRLKAESGSEPELLSEEEITSFQICNDALYYATEKNGKYQLIRMGKDGSSRTVIGEIGEMGASILDHLLYEGSVYGWAEKDYLDIPPGLYRVGLDGTEEVILSGYEYIIDYNYDDSVVAAGAWTYFETSKKVTDIDYETSHGIYNLDTGEKVLFPEEWFAGEKKILTGDQWVGPTDNIWPINVQNASRIYFLDSDLDADTTTIFGVGTDAERIDYGTY